MIFPDKNRIEIVTEKPRGGEGAICGLFPFASDSGPQGSLIKMVARMSLEVNSSIGWHEHLDDEEIYLITAGSGLFTDHDGREYAVGPGDLTMTLKGQGHALKNTGQVPLTFTAVIAKSV